MAIDACLKKVREEVRVSKGIIRGFTRNKDLHSSWRCMSERWGEGLLTTTHTIGDIYSIPRSDIVYQERQLLTIQKVSQCARPENTAIHVRGKLGEDANQGVEGEARDLQEVGLFNHQHQCN